MRRTNAAVPQCGVQWAAFFGDVEHEVQKVTSGQRITLTYVLHRTDGENSSTDALQLRAVNLQNNLRLALRNPRFLPNGGTLGFHARHKYEENALSATEVQP